MKILKVAYETCSSNLIWKTSHNLCKGSGISSILGYCVMALRRATGVIEGETGQWSVWSVTPAVMWIKASLALVHVLLADTHSLSTNSWLRVNPFPKHMDFFFKLKDENFFLRMCPCIVIGV
jgi:hypothetical protein